MAVYQTFTLLGGLLNIVLQIMYARNGDDAVIILGSILLYIVWVVFVNFFVKNLHQWKQDKEVWKLTQLAASDVIHC